jgi:hypothetical protein
MPKHVYATPEDAKEAKRKRDRERARARRAAKAADEPERAVPEVEPAIEHAAPVREPLMMWARSQVASGAPFDRVCDYGRLAPHEVAALRDWKRERR